MTKVTVGLFQAAPVAFDVAATIDKVDDLIAKAAREGVEFCLFPESFIPCYPMWASFGALIGAQSMQGREDFRRFRQTAVEVPGPATSRLGEIAKAHQVYLTIGVTERDLGSLYNTVLFFGPDGELLGKHRKVMPTGLERLIWTGGDGSTLTTIDTPFGRVGAAICWENYMPLLRAAMYAKGVGIYCAPTADHRSNWEASMQHIAFEGRCFVLGCNQFYRRSDFPDDYHMDRPATPETVMGHGGSMIVSPLGQVLAGPVFDREETLIATLDMDDLDLAKMDLDVVGHYSRDDIFQLLVNESPTPPVRFTST